MVPDMGLSMIPGKICNTTIHCPLPYPVYGIHRIWYGRGERNLQILTMMFSISGGYVPTVNGVHKECWMNYVTNG